MKKVTGLYIVYLLIVWGYFSFLYPLETYSETRYAAYAHAMFFSRLPLPWILLYILIKENYAGRWSAFAESKAKQEWIRTALFSAMLVGIYALVQLPFDLIWYGISLWGGTSHQAFLDWVFEWAINLLLFWLALSAMIFVARMLIKKFRKMWWFLLWLIAIPATLFIVYIQPVWIDPLYEDFSEIKPGPLRSAIEDFAAESGLEDAALLQVDMSEKTDTYNAYVTGILGNERIVLWDTTLKGMEQEEVLFILAHEVGHYVYHHVPLGVAGYLVLSFFLLWLLSLIYSKVWERLSKRPSWKESSELKAVPVLLLITSLLLSVAQPVSMAVSRQIETAADNYAIEHTENPAAGIDSFTKIAEQAKSDVDPVLWVKWIRFSHPPTEVRLDRIEAKVKERSH